jgi:hypothetical protein
VDGPVGAAPGIVVDQMVAVPGLGNAAGRAKPKIREMFDLAPREEADVPKGGLLGKLVADVVGSESGGAVTAIVQDDLQVLSWGVRCKLHGSTPSVERIV